MGPGMRWLTVCPPEQPDLEISLMAIDEGMMFNKESAAQMRELVRKETFGFGVFECNDLLNTYEELKLRGVKFTKMPRKEFYGFEELYKDDSGNWVPLEKRENQFKQVNSLSPFDRYYIHPAYDPQNSIGTNNQFVAQDKKR